jgi:hypothetical protein
MNIQKKTKFYWKKVETYSLWTSKFKNYVNMIVHLQKSYNYVIETFSNFCLTWEKKQMELITNKRLFQNKYFKVLAVLDTH